jgi:DNA topoisomerase-1
MDGSTTEGPKETGEICPDCGDKLGGKLIEREGKYGKFISCSKYPKCKFVKKTAEREAREKTGVACPRCKNGSPAGAKAGEIVERRGRFGSFYSCSNYPDCKFVIKARPTGKTCELCGSLMMEGTKTIPERCSNKECENKAPRLSDKSE